MSLKETGGPTAFRIVSRAWLGAVSAEGIKFWSLVSNRALAAVAAVFVPLNALLLSVSLRQRATDSNPAMHIASVEPRAYLDSVLWLQLLIAVIAVLLATNESGGRLGVSFLATPARIPVLAAKLVVIATLAFATGVIGALAGQLMPLFLLNKSGVRYDFSWSGGVLTALGAGLYLAGIGIVSLGIAVLVRNVVTAVLAPLALFTVIPSVIAWTGGEVGAHISGYFPTIAGRTAISALANPADLNGAGGFAVLGIWALIAAVAAALAYRYRDAG